MPFAVFLLRDSSVRCDGTKSYAGVVFDSLSFVGVIYQVLSQTNLYFEESSLGHEMYYSSRNYIVESSG